MGKSISFRFAQLEFLLICIDSRNIVFIFWDSDIISIRISVEIYTRLNFIATFFTLVLIAFLFIVILNYLFITLFALLTVHFLFTPALFESLTFFFNIILYLILFIYFINTPISLNLCLNTSFITWVTHILVALVFAPLLPTPDVDRCIANVTLHPIAFGVEPCLVLTLLQFVVVQTLGYGVRARVC